MKDEGAVAGRIAADLRMALRVVVLLAMASHAFPATATAQRVVVVYKEQQLLQVWNGGTLAAEFRICALSSIVGRKTRAGDRLVPEGIYRVTHMRRSASYKTIGIDYPNALEKAAGCTGSGIGIHGNCASSGCVGMRNDDMDALFAALRHDHPASVTVLLFYSRDHASVARLVSLFRSRNDERSALFLERLETVRLRWEARHCVPPWGWDEYGYLMKDEGCRMKEQKRDLIARTKEFALAIIRIGATLPRTPAEQVLARQVLRSGTSVGANYREAQRARSKAEFVAKIGDCL